MINLIVSFRFLIIVIIALVIASVYLIIKGKFKQTVYSLMLQAERQARKQILGLGQPQEDWVYTKLSVIFPKYIGLIGEARARSIIKVLFLKSKDLLDDGKLNGSVAEDVPITKVYTYTLNDGNIVESDKSVEVPTPTTIK